MSQLVAVVGDRGRLADTVRVAVGEARESARGDPVPVAFLVPVGDGADALRAPAAAALAERVRRLAATVTDGGPTAVSTDTDATATDTDDTDATATTAPPVTTATVTLTGADPAARTDSLVAALPADTARVVLASTLTELDPEGLTAALARADRADVSVERAPGRRVSRPPLALPATRRRVAATFTVSLGFYLALGDPTSGYDLATGTVSAAVVAAVLSRVAFETDPSRATVASLGRAVVFLPTLLVAVARANVAMAAVVLDPRLPIDPSVVRLPAPSGRIARALLANSVTLTPGTLTVDVDDDELVVHTLTRATRAELTDGGLARAVARVVGDDTTTPGDDTTTPPGDDTSITPLTGERPAGGGDAR